MIILGLTGFAQSGKSTVADYLVEHHGFTRVSFAAPLKKMLRTLDPVIGGSPSFKRFGGAGFRLSDLWEVGERMIVDAPDDAPDLSVDQWIKDSGWGEEYRRLLQVLGTDCIRAVDPEFWVKAAAKQCTDPNGKYVFDDCRFPNEATFIKTRNPDGLWNIFRPGFGAVNAHASEAHAGKLGESLGIANARTLEMLYSDVDAALAISQGVAA